MYVVVASEPWFRRGGWGRPGVEGRLVLYRMGKKKKTHAAGGWRRDQHMVLPMVIAYPRLGSPGCSFLFTALAVLSTFMFVE